MILIASAVAGGVTFYVLALNVFLKSLTFKLLPHGMWLLRWKPAAHTSELWFACKQTQEDCPEVVPLLKVMFALRRGRWCFLTGFKFYRNGWDCQRRAGMACDCIIYYFPSSRRLTSVLKSLCFMTTNNMWKIRQWKTLQICTYFKTNLSVKSIHSLYTQLLLYHFSICTYWLCLIPAVTQVQRFSWAFSPH